MGLNIRTFVIKNKRVGLIEYDGEQHYNPNLRGWFIRTYKDLHRRDIIKDNCCKTHNYKLYRIRYDEDVKKGWRR